MSVTADTRAGLRDRAAAVLHGNDEGSWTKASPILYPHQWSWDSAFIAIGWAHLDVGRAMLELEQLFAAQWATGMVPHLVFRAATPDHPYFPGPQWWDTSVSPAAPAAPVKTTGICQPPVHALALQRIWQLTPQALQPEIRARIQALYPRMVSWHRYLATQRDPEASGLVTTYHPWEATDNSPRWDRTLDRITVAKPGPYHRLDTTEVQASQRPTRWDYDRFLWLVEQLRKYRYDDAQIHREYPFLIKDVFFSAILVAANAALLDLADVAGASDEDRELLTRWLGRGRAGLASRFDPQAGLCFDYDVRTGEEIRLRTFAGFAPLFARTADAGQRAAQLRLLDSEDFCGYPRLRWRLLPSTSPAEPAFEPDNYWRGPVWPVINWLLWQSLSLLGYSARADEIRSDSLSQIAAHGDIAEYFEPFTGKQLGSPQQSFTAAVTLDWWASDHGGEAS